jgi:N,N'-diacetyllegionaminate synthase
MIKVNLIAEIGWNHMGNMSLAKEMIIAAKESGADYAKFQTWSVKNLTNGPWDKDGRREIYKKAELSKEMHEQLYEVCLKNNIKFLTSIFNINDLFKIENLKLDIIKIPSHEIYNLKLIEELLPKYQNLLVSTGAANWEEITSITKLNEFKKIIFMHCVSSYPCSFEMLNFNKFNELKKFSNNVGYSGHYDGIDDAKLAINFDAKYIEKHFTIDKNLPGRDNKFAILPDQFKKLSKYRYDFIEMKKNHNLNIQKSELDIFKNYRGRWGK